IKERAPPHSIRRNGRPASGAMMPSALNQVKDPQLRQSAISEFRLTKRVVVTAVTMSQKTAMNGVDDPFRRAWATNTVKIAHTAASSAGAQLRNPREITK